MIRNGWIMMLLGTCLLTSYGETATQLDPEALLIRATWYGNTQERRAMKSEAREEVQRRMPEIFQDIMDRIHVENIGLRVLAVELIHGQDRRDVAEVILSYLESEHALTRRHALFFLSLLDVPDAAVRVRPMLSDPEMQGGALRALAAWGDAASVPAMLPGLSSTNERIRVATANALRQLQHDDAVPSLIAALDDPMFTVRNAAARAMTAYGESILPVLEQSMDDPLSERHQRQILRVMVEIMGESAGSWLSEQRDQLTGSALRDVDWLLNWVDSATNLAPESHPIVVDRTLFGE